MCAPPASRIWSFASGPGAAETWSPPGFDPSGAEDAIRRPAVSGASGVAVRALTTSAADSVSTSMCHLSSVGWGVTLCAYRLSQELNRNDPFSGAGGLHCRGPEKGETMMPSKQSEAVRRRWEAARLAMTRADGEGPDDESWGDLTAEPRGVDYLETEAGGRPAVWGVAAGRRPGRGLLWLHGGGVVGGSGFSHPQVFGPSAQAGG